MDNRYIRSNSIYKNNEQRVNSSVNTNCKVLKKRFSEIEFAITEVVLYLDAYPESEDALAYYHKLLEERELLIQSINTQCGPMTQYCNISKESWQWTKAPWPWKYEAN